MPIMPPAIAAAKIANGNMYNCGNSNAYPTQTAASQPTNNLSFYTNIK